MNKYKITGFKHSQLPTGILKNPNSIIEKPEKVPDWLTAGINYLLPNLGDKKEVRNYQPITCL